MKSSAIDNYLQEIKDNSAYDKEFVELLTKSYTQSEDGEKTAQKVIAVVSRRYAENQKDQA